ncbi:MAG TPA: ABC transporter transmembrane domain-containing protein [Iamia sp.]
MRPLEIVVEGPDGSRRAVGVDRPVVVGRAGCDADVLTTDPTVSRRHLALAPADGGLRVEDLGSRFGTRVDGEAIDGPVIAAAGSRLELGCTTLIVRRAGATTAEGTLPPRPSDLVTVERDGVEVRYRPGSAGADAADAVADLARRARRALAGFGTEPTDGPVAVHLVDPFPDPDDPGRLVTTGTVVDGAEVWMVVTPEAPPDDPHRSLALVFGRDLPAAEAVAHLVEGYGLWLAGPAATDDPEERAAFVGFLVAREGEPALRTLLAAPAGQLGATWEQVYGRPAAAMERAWRSSVARDASRARGTSTFLRLSWRYLRPYRRRQAEVLVYLLLSLAFTAVYPFVTRRLFDDALPNGRLSDVLTLVAALGAAFGVSLVAGLRQGYLTASIGASVVRDLRREMFARVQRLPDRWVAEHPQGDVLSRLVSDVNRVQAGLTTAIGDGVFHAVSLLVSTAIMLTISPTLAVVVLIAVPLVAVTYRRMANGALTRSLALSEDAGSVVEVAAENYQALPVVKAFGLAGREEARFARASDRLVRSQLRMALFGGVFGLAVSGISTLVRLVTIALGAWLIFEGRLTIGGLVAFLGIMGEVLAPVTGLTDLGQGVQESLGSLARLDEILDAPSEDEDEHAPDLAPLAGAIRLEGVAVAYTPDRRALDRIDLVIPAGSRVAIVGPSGSGKSTLLRVLLRQAAPDEGRVLFDDVDGAERSLASLRRQMGVVFQDSFLFEGTIGENIALGAPGATDEQVRAAAVAAEVDDFVAGLPHGYDTPVGPGGTNLSGGQRQRVALARALVREPRILLLDEATSALDARTERQVARTLAAVAQGRTTVTVTHRLATVVDHDRIVVVVGGRVAEMGTHPELLARGGTYAHLWAEQTGTEPPAPPPFDTAGALARLPLFRGLDDAALAEVSALLRVVTARAGDVVAEADGSLVLVVSGQAWSDGGPTGDRDLGPGGVFGLSAALGQLRGGVLVGREDVRALVLDPEDLADLAHRYPAIAAARAGAPVGPRSGSVLRPVQIGAPPPRPFQPVDAGGAP